MPKGKRKVRQRSSSNRRKHRTGRRRRNVWVQYMVTAAQVLSAVAAVIEAIRR